MKDQELKSNKTRNLFPWRRNDECSKQISQRKASLIDDSSRFVTRRWKVSDFFVSEIRANSCYYRKEV